MRQNWHHPCDHWDWICDPFHVIGFLICNGGVFPTVSTTATMPISKATASRRSTMPKPVPSYPFPQRSPLKHSDVLYSNIDPSHTEIYQAMYARSQGDEAKLWRFQYMGIEEELERSFRFVH